MECHGSQCGFCTPGFVMSPVGELRAPSRVRRDAEPPGAGRRWLSATCAAAPATGPSSTPGSACSSCPPPSSTPRRCWPRCSGMQAARPADAAPGAAFFAPRTLDALAELRRAARGTPARRLHRHRPVGQQAVPRARRLIYLGNVAELRASRNGWLRIGAGASLEDAWRALAATGLRSPRSGCASPRRRSATPAPGRQRRQRLADRRLAPILMALDAQIVLRRGTASAGCRCPTSTSTT